MPVLKAIELDFLREYIFMASVGRSIDKLQGETAAGRGCVGRCMGDGSDGMAHSIAFGLRDLLSDTLKYCALRAKAMLSGLQSGFAKIFSLGCDVHDFLWRQIFFSSLYQARARA